MISDERLEGTAQPPLPSAITAHEYDIEYNYEYNDEQNHGNIIGIDFEPDCFSLAAIALNAILASFATTTPANSCNDNSNSNDHTNRTRRLPQSLKNLHMALLRTSAETYTNHNALLPHGPKSIQAVDAFVSAVRNVARDHQCYRQGVVGDLVRCVGYSVQNVGWNDSSEFSKGAVVAGLHETINYMRYQQIQHLRPYNTKKLSSNQHPLLPHLITLKKHVLSNDSVDFDLILLIAIKVSFLSHQQAADYVWGLDRLVETIEGAAWEALESGVREMAKWYASNYHFLRKILYNSNFSNNDLNQDTNVFKGPAHLSNIRDPVSSFSGSKDADVVVKRRKRKPKSKQQRIRSWSENSSSSANSSSSSSLSVCSETVADLEQRVGSSDSGREVNFQSESHSGGRPVGNGKRDSG
ncbi:hypothetical protein HK100_007364, partial [Physocladia obscura]